MAVRCIFCSRIIEEETLNIRSSEDEEEEMQVKKPMTVCVRCQAKLKHEAEDSQKIPKPL